MAQPLTRRPSSALLRCQLQCSFIVLLYDSVRPSLSPRIASKHELYQAKYSLIGGGIIGGMIFIILAMLLYTAVIMLGAVASRNANTNLVTAISNTFSAFIPLAVSVHLLNKKELVSNKYGVYFAVLAGLTVGLFVMALNKSYSLNKVGIVAPIVFGGAIFLSTILSYFLFNEKVSLLQFIGLALLGLGFVLIIIAQLQAK